MSILPMPDLTPGTAESPLADAPRPIENIHFSSLDAYAVISGALEGVSFWPRAAARVIDMIVHYVIAMCCGFMLGVMVATVAALQHNPRALLFMRRPGSTFAIFVFSLLGSVALETVCEGFHGSTPGKMILGMVVVQEDGSPCRPWPALVRSLAYFIDGLFFGLIGYAAMTKTPQQQRHGDEWAHTIVCRQSQLAPQNLRGFAHFTMVFLLAAMADSMIIITGLLIKALG